MSLERLIPELSRARSMENALRNAERDADFSLVEGLRAPLIAGLVEHRATRAVLAVTPTSREAEALKQALECFAPEAEILTFPAWETLPHERLSPSAETVGRRIAALRRLHRWDGSRPIVVLASVRAALQPIAAGLAEAASVPLVGGSRGNELSAIAVRLVELAYTRVDMVTRRGEFAVRGGILDVFPPDAEHPVRVEFFGDELEQIRQFSVADQRSTPGDIASVELLPSREVLLTEGVRARAREMQHEFPNLTQMLEKIAEGIPVEGMESLAPALVDQLVPLTAYLPPDAAVALISPERIASRAANLVETNREFLAAAWNAATVGAQAPISLDAGDFLGVRDLRRAAGGRAWWTLSTFDSGAAPSSPADRGAAGGSGPADRVAAAGAGSADRVAAAGAGSADRVAAGGGVSRSLTDADIAALVEDAGEYVRLDGDRVPSAAGSPDAGLAHVAERLRTGWTVAVVAQGTGLVERAGQVLADRELSGRPVDVFPAEPEPAVAYLLQGTVESGFEVPELKLALVSEAELFGRSVGYDSRQVKKLASRRRNVVDPLQLKTGDYVVHATHGIGRFVEMQRREVGGGARQVSPLARKGTASAPAIREYLVIEYAPSKRGHAGDRLLVPTDQLDLLSRYVGGEAPQLSKMGGSDWAAAKGRARKAVRDIAVELVKLYSARMASKGHAFGPDTPWQRELEEAFPFAETQDQLTTIDEVKADMERPIPMDRLISGDVGYGKTEVAVRAAFKAIQDGKQVVMLVPTTLLVRQHLETFTERFAGFPVHVRPLSRFQSAKESKDTIDGLARGEIDMVIGTHRILSDSVQFKGLGLVIIDEEQRFGVEHKDQLKKLRTNVDVLAMSATPIPRTLEMAVTGIREMSTLATPPEDRHPILTFVGPQTDTQVAAAIRRELLREGQVFYVHNRVQSIGRTAAHLAELVPEARIAVAHGQLGEHQLEQVMVDFWERRFDVLVCTTIIETGIDIANANTLIIDRADKYGLSQLHQIRGRVGRGRERAYAYFLYDPDKPLSETAHDRLATIAANTELGGGMQIALKDLEIRGAGNLLGGEQSGHIQGVGFDLYLRMIGEAVSTFRGDVAEGQTELRLELPVDAHIPEDYIESERLRLEAYQKVSTASAPASPDDAIDEVLDELADRYGDPPLAVVMLGRVARLRRLAQKAGLSEVVAMGRNLRVAGVALPDSLQVRLQRLYPGAKYFAQTDAVSVPMPAGEGERTDDELLQWTTALLEAIYGRVATPEAQASA